MCVFGIRHVYDMYMDHRSYNINVVAIITINICTYVKCVYLVYMRILLQLLGPNLTTVYSIQYGTFSLK